MKKLILVLLLLLAINCRTLVVGNFKYIEPAPKDSQYQKKPVIIKDCSTNQINPLDAAFSNAKVDSIKNTSIVLSLEGMSACYTMYGEKQEQVEANNP
jgi:hypothetical protein